MAEKSILIFGAGKIGRSFIGQLFSLSGYEVVFSDIAPELLQALNERRSYPVVIKGEKEETLLIRNVRAVSGLNRKQVVHEVSKASILAVSVGKNALEKVIPLIGQGLKVRYQSDPDRPLDIIIAENMRSADKFLYRELSSCLPKEYPIDELVGLVETSIGKMVPIMTKADLEGDPLLVFAEPYNSLIVDKKGFRGPIPEVKGLCPRENIKAWVDRKAFVHNFGHATVAYFGAYKYPGATYIYEVLKDKEVYRFAFDAMLQSASVLQANYPNDFSLADLQGHIEDLLYRFQNKALKDTIFRVGQDRLRKLGPDDRFMGIIRLAISLELKFDKILKAMAYAFYFHAKDENSNISEPDILFDNYLEQGPEYTLQRVCGFDQSKDKNLFEEFMTYHEALNVRNSLKMRKLQIKNSRYDDKTKTIGL